MKTYKTKTNVNILIFSVLFILIGCIKSVPLLSQDKPAFQENNTTVRNNYDNIGFKKDVSDKTRKRFSFCDQFLNIEWFDKEKPVGKLKTEIYFKGKEKDSNATFLEKKIKYYLVMPKEIGSKEMVKYGDRLFIKIDKADYQSKQFETFAKNAEFIFQGKGFYDMKYGNTIKKKYQ